MLYQTNAVLNPMLYSKLCCNQSSAILHSLLMHITYSFPFHGISPILHLIPSIIPFYGMYTIPCYMPSHAIFLFHAISISRAYFILSYMYVSSHASFNSHFIFPVLCYYIPLRCENTSNYQRGGRFWHGSANKIHVQVVCTAKTGCLNHCVHHFPLA